ncbi:hypothetical protein QOT17_008367 [Balamuthia mandrillaris]
METPEAGTTREKTGEDLSSFKHKYTLEVPLLSAEYATIVCNTLKVDKELKESIVHRELSTEDNVLKISYATKDIRMLRTVVSSSFDMLLLSLETLHAFGSTPDHST